VGNAAGQQKAMREFQRLRRKSSNLEAAKGLFSSADEITRQKADPDTIP
jgi:hypothetical protein